MKTIKVKIDKLKPSEKNPRIISDSEMQKLVKSITDFPEMLNIRPIVVTPDMTIIGGNQRYKACLIAGIKELSVIVAENLTPEQLDEFLIKDNVSAGDWDYNILLENWKTQPLNDWGMEVDFPEEPSFEPILQPNTNYSEVTREEINRKATELAKEMVKTHVMKEVMCPDCGCEFNIQ